MRNFFYVVLVLAVLIPFLFPGCRCEKTGVSSEDQTPIQSLIIKARIMKQLESRRFEGMMEHPQVDRAMDKMFERVGEHPSMDAAWVAFFNQLGANPDIGQAAERFMAKFVERKSMQEFVLKIIAENPDLNQDQVGDTAAKKIDEIMSNSAWDDAFDRAFNRLVELPRVNKAFEQFGTALVSDALFEKKIDAHIDAFMLTDDMSALFTRLSDGHPPGDLKSIELVIDRLFTRERVVALLAGFFSTKALSDDLGTEIARLIGQPAFAQSIAPHIARIISDPQVEKHALELFDVLISDKLDKSAMEKSLTSSFQQPVVADMLIDILNEQSKRNPDLIDGVRKALIAAFVSPEFTKLLKETLLAAK